MILLANNFTCLMETHGPLVAEAWITNIQLLHETLGCTKKQKVKYTRLRITDEAARWWKSKKELLQLELGHKAVIPWDRFVEEFNGHFFPREQIEKLNDDSNINKCVQ
jgi:hypothetical protein